MKISMDWLNDFVNVRDIPVEEYAKKMTLTGSIVEQVIEYDQLNTNVVIGKILSVEKHPQADKLLCLKVDIGRDVLDIVTGAPNVEKDALVVVAVEGATLANGMKIENTEFRGVPSQGMLCSYQELGFTSSVIPKNSEKGIIILEGDYPLGDYFFAALGLSYPVVEFELTFNRPDCLSIMGLGYETAATFKRKRKPFSCYKGGFQGRYSVTLDEEICSTYLLVELDNVHIAPSPQWIQLRLMSIGIRPINNLVDLTNYVMMELGNPIHAFDADKLTSSSLEVRLADKGETLITLDDQKRSLLCEDILITNEDVPVALAGVMGGKTTEVTEDTKRTVLEIANFRKDLIRKTSHRLGLRSEASARFEKGIDHARALQTVERILELKDVFGLQGTFQGVSGKYFDEAQEHVFVRPERVNEVLGTKISVQEMKEILLQLEIETTGTDVLRCKAPEFRKDLVIEEDFIEEIARIYGYDRIISKIPKVYADGEIPPRLAFREKIRDILWSCGLDEMLNYSFVSKKSVEDLHITKKPIALKNPLGEDYSQMRPTLLVSALDVLRRNERYLNESVAFYEIGNVFYEEADHYQREKLSIAAYGEMDFFTLKGVLETLLEELGYNDVTVKENEDEKLFHTGRSAILYVQGKRIGIFGELSLYIKEELKMDHRCYLAEIDLDDLYSIQREETKYEPLSRYPSIIRDISLLVDKKTTHEEIVKVIRSKGGELVQKIELFDVYYGSELGEGKKSMSYSVVFNSDERTLKDEEVEPYYNEIVAGLLENLKATRR